MTGIGDPVFLEVVERTPAYRPDGQGAAALIKPNEVRLNGQRLAVPAGESIQVHGMGLSDDDVVQVTLTLFCRGVRVAMEGVDDSRPAAAAPVPSPGPVVTLPEHWEVSQQDGTRPYGDEPDELIPAGVYLFGQTEPGEPETTSVILRADFAVDPDSRATSDEVLQAIANRLNAARAEG